MGGWAIPIKPGGVDLDTGLPRVVQDRETGIVLVLVSPGLVEIASSEFDETDDDRKAVRVHAVLSRPFYVGMSEVRQREWERIMGTNPSCGGTGADLPVDSVSEADLQRFMRRTGFRLPTEAEWVRAAAMGHLAEPAGDMGTIGWFEGNSSSYWRSRSAAPLPAYASRAVPCALKPPSRLGLYDQFGNVAEICSDWHAYLEATGVVAVDPVGPSQPGPQGRVVRGGRWSDDARDMSHRWRASQLDVARSEVGVRVARDP